MTQAAEDGTTQDPMSRHEESGRFLIAPRPSETVLPPPTEAASRDFALDELDEIEPLEDATLELAPPPAPTLPPPPPAAALAVKSQRPAAPAAVEEVPSALHAFYGGLRSSEHAELRIDDLSFDPDNPYARSSLLPPPPKPFPLLKVVGGVVCAAALAAAGYGVTLGHLRSHQLRVDTRTVAMAAAAAPVMAAPAPQAVAAPVVTTPAPAPVALAAPVPAATLPAKSVVAKVIDVERAKAASVAHETAVASTAQMATRHEAAAVAAPAATAGLAANPTEEAAPAATTAPTRAVVAAAEPAAVEPTAVEAALPESPTRDEIKAGFDAVRSDVEICAAGGHGTTLAKVTISGAGRVSYATIEGAFQGTPQGSCIARALRTASFPRFAQASLKVSYSFGI